MNILITGGAGFIGSHLSENLNDDKRVKKIYIIDNLSSGSKKYFKNIKRQKLNLLNKILEILIKLKNILEIFQPSFI